MTNKLKVYNSLSGEKEEFVPIQKDVVGMYVCGPTVYGPLHVGHARTMVAFDMIKNYIQYFQEEIKKVIYISNITDVGHIVGDVDDGEDKIQRKANLDKKHPMEIVDEYIKNMWDGMDSLKCDRPNIAPRATGHISEIIDAVKILVEKGYAYELDGSIYFDVSKAVDYGKLSGNKLEDLEKDVRIQSKDNKRNPADFALWKRAEKEHIMQWSSPWGLGFPGWHIECSVMSQKYLGDTFDIHGGARELKFPHHENEIAQSQALVGHKAVNYWLHTGLLLIDGVKMSKSLGNFITIEDILKKYDAEIIRYLIVSHHYSKEIDMKESALVAAQNSLKNINNFIFQLKQNGKSDYNQTLSNFLKEFETEFNNTMNDDFNTPNALVCLFNFINQTNKIIDSGDYNDTNVNEIILFFEKINKIFKIFNINEHKKNNSNDILIIENLIKLRKNAREGKNWQLSDQIRDVLLESGIELFDKKDGVTTRKS